MRILHCYDVLTGEITKSYLFVGAENTIPNQVRNELLKLQSISDIKNNAILEAHYGPILKQLVKGGDTNYTDTDYIEDDPTEFLYDDIVTMTDNIPDDFVKDLTNDVMHEPNPSNVINEEFKNDDINDIIHDNIDDHSHNFNDILMYGGDANLLELEDSSDEDSMDVITMSDLTMEVAENKQVSIHKNKNSKVTVVFMDIFDMDSVLDFKSKIQIVTGIPLYKQHLYTIRNKQIIPLSYQIYVNDQNIPISIEYVTDVLKTKNYDNVSGYYVDMHLYNNREFIKVISNDAFSLITDNVFYLSNLDDIITDVSVSDLQVQDLLYYGFIIKFFPMLTKVAYQEYLTDEKNIQMAYPNIHPNTKKLTSKYEAMDSIVNYGYNCHQLINSKFKSVQDKINTSILETTIQNTSNLQTFNDLIDLRNLFDLITLTENIKEVHFTTFIDRNTTVFSKTRVADNSTYIYNNSLANSVTLFIQTESKTAQIKLTIYRNGNYIITSKWGSELYMNFSKITSIVTSLVNNILVDINKKYGSKVLNYSVMLSLLTKDNIKFSNTKIHYAYDIDFNDHIDVFNSIIDDYKYAGIITSYNAPNKATTDQSFIFNKGFSDIDVKYFGTFYKTSNYYDYLTNESENDKWHQIFTNTKVFTVTQIINKVYINIAGIYNTNELRNFDILVFGLIVKFLEQTKNAKKKSSKSNKNVSSIKNLKMQDKLLYDLKKIYDSDIDYSKICQKKYQPMILSDEEYNKLSNSKKQYAVKYMNFTEKKLVWYSCPYNEHKYVKFLTGKHPKGYCIPCCKKTEVSDKMNESRVNIHNTCLSKYEYTDERKLATVSSTYVSAYGKYLEVGRLSRLPEDSLDIIFSENNTHTNDLECNSSSGFYLYGISQSGSYVNDIGVINVIAHVLDLTIDELLKETSKRFQNMPHIYNFLLHGKISRYFNDVAHLIKCIKLLNSDELQQDIPWNDIFVHLAFHLFNINVVIFDDIHKGQIDLNVSNLTSINDILNPNNSSVILIKRESINRLDKKTVITYNPIYNCNSDLFYKSGIINTKLYKSTDYIISIIVSMLKHHLKTKTTNFTIHTLTNFIYSTSNQNKIKMQYINRSNKCYAAELTFNRSNIIIPVEYSDFDTKLPFSYDTTFNKTTTIDNIFYFTKMYNIWSNEQKNVSNLEIDSILTHNNTIIGVTINKLYTQCLAENSQTNLSGIPIKTLLFDPFIVNAEIRHQDTVINRVNDYKALYELYLYKIFINQYAKHFNTIKNTTMYKKIRKAIESKNINTLKSDLSSTDFKKVKAYSSKLIDEQDMSKYNFEFDRQSYITLTNSTQQEVKEYLKKHADTLFVFKELSQIKITDRINILSDCIIGLNSYCIGNKVAIPKDKFNQFIDILSSNIVSNLHKNTLFNSSLLNKVANYYKFIQRKNEKIMVNIIE